MVAYTQILGQTTNRLLALRVTWSELGALRQTLDELACRISFYRYITGFADLFLENIEANREYEHCQEIHPHAVELFQQDRALAQWIEVNPRAPVVLTHTSVDHYLATLSKQRSRLQEIREQESASELEMLYMLLDEACAEAACWRERAKMATHDLLKK